MNCLTVILAGGKGTRIRHLLPELPKPLASVNGQPFLAWILCLLEKQGFAKVVISTGYLSNKINDFVQNVKFFGLEISCSEELIPLGTAGGVLYAIQEYGNEFDSVLVLNGDSLVLVDLKPLLIAFEDESIDVVILGVEVKDAQRFGALKVGADDLLVGFDEKRPGFGLVNAGIYLFRKKTLEKFQSKGFLSFEIDIFPKMLAKNLNIKVIRSDAPFIDIGTEESLRQADTFIQINKNYFN